MPLADGTLLVGSENGNVHAKEGVALILDKLSPREQDRLLRRMIIMAELLLEKSR